MEKWPDWVVLESYAAIGEVKLCLCRDERRVVIVVEWVRAVGARADRADLVDRSSEILGQGW